jgi:Protein of unknown function (DUF3592)
MFLDTFLIWLVKVIRKCLRIRRAQKWSIVEGKVQRSQIIEDGFNKYRPVADYSFVLSGETYYGQARSYPQNNEVAADLADTLAPESSLMIRYNRADPYKNMVLNRDNPAARVYFDE